MVVQMTTSHNVITPSTEIHHTPENMSRNTNIVIKVHHSPEVSLLRGGVPEWGPAAMA
jgi:hypothetical protein